jgi:hypothetical protein
MWKWTYIVLLGLAALAACKKDSADPAAPAATVAAGEGTGRNPFAKRAPETTTTTTTTPGTAAATEPALGAGPAATPQAAGAAGTPGSAKPAFPGTRPGGKPAFPIPGAAAGTPAPPAPPGGIPGLPPGITLPAGLPPEATAMINDSVGDLLSGGLEELPERPGLPNWKRFVALLPAQLGEFTAQGEVDGMTAEVMGMATTTASRRYRAADGRTAEIILSGGDVAGLMSMEFAFPQPDEVTPESVHRTVQVAGKPATVEWTKESGEAGARTLVADKFSVMITVHRAPNPDVAQTLLQALDLAALAQIP